MTREEAEKIILSVPSTPAWEADAVERLVRLGILKLEEPKTPREKFKDYLEKICGWSGPGGIYACALEAFDASQK